MPESEDISTTADWELVLSEEFDADRLADPDGPWLAPNPGGETHGDEPQYYTHYNKDFVTDCDKGGRNHVYDFDATTLSLRAKVEPGAYQVPSRPYFRYFGYTSGLIFSKQTFVYVNPEHWEHEPVNSYGATYDVPAPPDVTEAFHT
jgi:hypothetical protein